MNILAIILFSFIALFFVSLFVFIFVDEAARRREYAEERELDRQLKKIRERNEETMLKMHREYSHR